VAGEARREVINELRQALEGTLESQGVLEEQGMYSRMIQFSLALLVGVTLSYQVIAGSQWLYKKQTDEFDDSVSHNAIAIVDSSALSPAMIFVQCTGDNNLGIALKESLMFHIEDTIKIKYRFDKEEVVEDEWLYGSKMNGALLLEEPANKFARLLMRHNRIVYKVGDNVTRKISLQGSKEPIRKVLNACGLE
jgi:hypothetical protein